MIRYFELDTREGVMPKDLDHCSLYCTYLIEIRDRDLETGEFVDPFFQCVLYGIDRLTEDSGGVLRCGSCKVFNWDGKGVNIDR